MLINAEMLFNWAVPEWMELFNMAFIFEDQQHLQKFWESDIGADLGKRLVEKIRRSRLPEHHRSAWSPLPDRQQTHLQRQRHGGVKLRTPNNAGVIASWTATGANVTPVAWGELVRRSADRYRQRPGRTPWPTSIRLACTRFRAI